MAYSEEQILVLLRQIGEHSRAPAKAEQAIEKLYDAFSANIKRYLITRMRTEEATAAEIVNDTLLEIWTHPNRFDGRSRFRTYLFRIAHNQAIDRLRRKKFEPVAIPDDLPDTLPELPDQLHQEEIRKGLSYCLERLVASGKLSVEQQEVLHLAYAEDFDLAEIAEVVGCPINTVKTRLHYGRQRIAQCLRNKLGDNQHA